ncbi:hypothetical protein DYB26_003976 [Aphanomyces astaci]|uniref:DDE-1 domain-containing protein n=1 Tax=Aphanomyces astaci TaxID=112090 RepID=A0A397BUQ7_APHAT|nr:hypothetical protein DYB36_012513 [Aphanomyces astaci]RHZ28081.1 hypothetical protein DYB26_003976 [Aphanomyces astaci]
MTAELSVRANGEKLPILFIMRGVTGGLIEPNKFETFYDVQEKTWIDARVWAYYLPSVLKPQVRAPSTSTPT